MIETSFHEILKSKIHELQKNNKNGELNMFRMTRSIFYNESACGWQEGFRLRF